MSKNKCCTGCGQPTTDVLTIPGLRLALPYHPACSDAARRDLRAVLDGIAEALVARRRSGPCNGALPRADEI